MKKKGIYLLSIETSTKLCSVTISCDEELITTVEASSNQYIHAESLHPFIGKAIKKANIKMNQFDAIVVGKGPGSYTGLRIGVSAAKGLAYPLSIPVIAINSLEAIANAAHLKYPARAIIPMIDARRDEVYALFYNQKGEVEVDAQAVILEKSKSIFDLKLESKDSIIVGDAAGKAKVILGDVYQYDLELTHSASNLVPIALDRFKKDDFEDLAYFEPFYLKEFIAAKPKTQFKNA